MPRKILIVDDEPDTMQKLVRLSGLESLGYSLCAILPDGRDAIEYLQTHEVDVVVTDIIMTFVSGLELCKHIKKNYPDIYTVILSGHDDFRYAQSAVSLGVFRYLLKPVSLREFKEVLTEIHNIISENEKKRLPDVSVASETFSLMKRQLYTEYLFGNISASEFKKGINPYESAPKDIMESSGVLAEIEMCNFYDFIAGSWNYSHENFNEALDRLVSMYENVSAVLTNMEDNRFEIILFCKNNVSPDVILTRFIKLFKEITNIETNILQTTAFTHFSELSGYYLSGTSTSARIVHQRIRRLANSFGTYVLSGDTSAAQTSINNIYVLLRSLSLNEAKYIILEILEAYKEHIPAPEQSIYSAQNTEALIIATDKLTKSLFNLDRSGQRSKIISEAKDYITKHSSEDITLETVADYVHLNHIYFSRLFKQITGENYSDYLLNIRISKACELLATNMKIYEISSAVGYKNVKYFSEIFKKRIGVLPSEYRSIVKSKGSLS